MIRAVPVILASREFLQSAEAASRIRSLEELVPGRHFSDPVVVAELPFLGVTASLAGIHAPIITLVGVPVGSGSAVAALAGVMAAASKHSSELILLLDASVDRSVHRDHRRDVIHALRRARAGKIVCFSNEDGIPTGDFAFAPETFIEQFSRLNPALYSFTARAVGAAIADDNLLLLNDTPFCRMPGTITDLLLHEGDEIERTEFRTALPGFYSPWRTQSPAPGFIA